MNFLDQKEEFFQDCLRNGKYQSTTIVTLRKIFNSIEPFEHQLGKDLAYFDENQVEKLFEFLSKSKGKITLYAICSYISNYYQWCIDKKIIVNEPNLYNAKKLHTIIDKFIPNSIYKERYFSKEEMQHYVSMIHDITDKFIAYSFFFNIKDGRLDDDTDNTGKDNNIRSDYPELTHIKMKDLNEATKTLYLSYSNREVKVDDFFIDLMKRANEATYYDDGTDNYRGFNDYVSSGYVLKRRKRKGSAEPLTKAMLQNRCAAIKTQTDGHIDFSTASMNGLIYYVQRQFNIQQGISLEKALISDKYDGKGYIHDSDTERYISEFRKGIKARSLRRNIRMFIDKFLDNENNEAENRISIIPEIRIIELNSNLSVGETQKKLISNIYYNNQCKYLYSSLNITWRSNTLLFFKSNEYIIACARIEKSIPNINTDSILYFYPESIKVFKPFTLAEIIAKFPNVKFYKGECIVNPSPSTITEIYMMINENADSYDVSKEITELTTITAEEEAINLNLSQLWEHVSNNAKMNHYVIHKQHTRDPYLKELVKRLARGNCQFCKKTAPFNDKNDRPYLEEHHVLYLANGGPDVLHNVIALCPNCHRQLHIKEDNSDIRKAKEIAYKNVELLNQLVEKNSVS